MSPNPSGFLYLSIALAVFGGAYVLFPRLPFLQVWNPGKRFGKVKDNTRSFGFVFLGFAAMFFGMWLFLIL